MAKDDYAKNLKEVGTTYLYLFVIVIILFRWIFSIIKFILTIIPRFIRWIFRLPKKNKTSKITNPIKEIAMLNTAPAPKSKNVDRLDLLGLEEYQKDLVKSGEQYEHNFEEEDMDEDDYFHDDA